MDVERTMQFILESQARAEARSDKADARFDKADARFDKAEARFDRADARADRADARADRADARMDKMEKRSEREISAIRKLLQQGMKALAELTAAQKETDRALRAFIKSSRNGGNRRNGENGH